MCSLMKQVVRTGAPDVFSNEAGSSQGAHVFSNEAGSSHRCS